MSAVPESPWRRIGATAVVVGGSLVAAGVLGTVVGWAIVTGHGQVAVAAGVGAVSGSVTTGLVVRWRTGQELAAEIAANDRWTLADARYDLDEFPSPYPPQSRRGL